MLTLHESHHAQVAWLAIQMAGFSIRRRREKIGGALVSSTRMRESRRLGPRKRRGKMGWGPESGPKGGDLQLRFTPPGTEPPSRPRPRRRTSRPPTTLQGEFGASCMVKRGKLRVPSTLILLPLHPTSPMHVSL